MKQLITSIFFIMAVVNCFANAGFDKTINYQFNNAKAYEGEVLYLQPLTNSRYEKRTFPIDKYPWFMDYSFNDVEDTEVSTILQYKFQWGHPLDGKVGGTHKRHIEGHRFYVDKVAQYADYGDTWVFHLTDLNTGDKLKFIYHGYVRFYIGEFSDFPFIVEKHLKYCKSLIGSKLVFATNPCKVLLMEMGTYYYHTFEEDIKTGEKIQYDDVYAKWTIKDVLIDQYNMCIAFIVTDGQHTTKVPFNIQYAVNHPKYNIGNRVFTEQQWNALVAKYGEKHMRMIMNTEVSDDMTLEEKYMAGGRKLTKEPDAIDRFFKRDKKKHNSVGSTIIESTKVLFKDLEAIGKSLLGK